LNTILPKLHLKDFKNIDLDMILKIDGPSWMRARVEDPMMELFD